MVFMEYKVNMDGRAEIFIWKTIKGRLDFEV